jgi:hypothetical protein
MFQLTHSTKTTLFSVILDAVTGRRERKTTLTECRQLNACSLNGLRGFKSQLRVIFWFLRVEVHRGRFH